MKNQFRFRAYNPDQLMLFVPDLKQWLPENDLVYFIIDVVSELDLEPIYRQYSRGKGGQPPYHPKMMAGRANASRHKAMSYQRMDDKISKLQAQVQKLLKDAEACDRQEDALYGKGRRSDPLPKQLKHRKSRLERIRKAKKAIEQEAQDNFIIQQKQYQKKLKAKKQRSDHRGRPPKAPSEKPDPKRQFNFTDPDSRVMVDGATKSFQQSYNCQAEVDKKAKVIIAFGFTQQTNDKLQVKPLINTVKANAGMVPEKLSADAGYFSEDNCSYLQTEQINAFIATEKTNKLANAEAPRGRIPKKASTTERMTRKLQTVKGRSVCAKRKHIVEPVFGQIKEARGFRRFSFRGLKNASAEWDIVCLIHNLLKLYRSGWRPATA